MIDNVAELLNSKAVNDQKIALEMLASAGVPTPILTDLFLLHKNNKNDTKIRKEARKLLYMNASNQLMNRLDNKRFQYRNSFNRLARPQEWYEYLRFYALSTELDGFRILQSGIGHPPVEAEDYLDLFERYAQNFEQALLVEEARQARGEAVRLNNILPTHRPAFRTIRNLELFASSDFRYRYNDEKTNQSLEDLKLFDQLEVLHFYVSDKLKKERPSVYTEIAEIIRSFLHLKEIYADYNTWSLGNYLKEYGSKTT